MKLTKEDIINNVNKKISQINSRKDRNISFVGIYQDNIVGNQTRLILKCNIHNTTWDTTTYNNFMKLSFAGGCKECKSETTTKVHKFSPEEAKEKVELIHKNSKYNYDFSPILKTYGAFHEKVTVICPKHGQFEVVYCNLLREENSGMCPECRKEALSKRVSNDIYGNEVQNRISDKINLLKIKFNSDIEYLGIKENKSDTRPMRQYLILKCKIHDVTWDTTNIDNFIHDENIIGCPICRNSSNKEIEVWEILKRLISIEDNLVRHYKIELENRCIVPDFYISNKNIIIEYDGVQHYEYVPYFHNHSYQGIVNQVNRDRALEKYCEENGIKLLRIPYLDNNRLQEVIEDFLVRGINTTTKIEPKLLPAIIYGQDIISRP